MRQLAARGVLVPAVLALAFVPAASPAGADDDDGRTYRSPYDCAFSPDGKLLAVSDHTAAAVAIVSPSSGKVLRQVGLTGRPAGLAWSGDGERVYVAEEGAGSVAEVDAGAGKVLRRLPAGPYVCDVAVVPGGKRLLATNAGLASLSVIDLEAGKEVKRVGMISWPRSVAVGPKGRVAVVGNLLPVGDARDAGHSAAVSVVDLKRLERTGDVRLPGGSTLLRDVVVSGDGRWAYACHTVGRFTLPTTQLERGWVNTNALSIIDLTGRAPAERAAEAAAGEEKPKERAKPPAGEAPKPAEKAKKEAAAGDDGGDEAKAPPGATAPARYATVLLDFLSEGGADPWGLALSPDGKTLWVTLSGVHQLARVDLAKLHPLLAGKVAEPIGKTLKELDKYRQAGVQVTWLEIKAEPKARELLVNDLTAMYVAGVLKRAPLPGRGPRGVSASPDGKTVAAAVYFSGNVALADASTSKAGKAVSLGPQPPANAVRLGERIFHDATYCFQHWLSCATCHPDGRSDGLNWDLLNDGMGNPKNSKSLPWSHRTPPAMSTGVRASMAVASEKGFRFILFRVPEKNEDEAVQAYLKSLRPAPSPHLAEGKLSERARRGRKLFESSRTDCASCHPGPLYTDLKMYKVGTRHELDRRDDFDTPTLVELWRTAPFLHDGSAATVKDVLTAHNKSDRHGKTSKLSKQEIDDLTAYLLSL